MSLFKITDSKLTPIKEVNFESHFDKEKKLQNFTENNLDILFGLQFVSTEFNIESFWLDSLAYDPITKAFVIIEYKKVENYSLMDQGQTYLNLVLDHKGDTLQEYFEKTGKSLNKSSVDWSQTRAIFIGPKFNTYQRRALSPNLPFELWEVIIYDNDLIEYNAINPVGASSKSGRKSTSLSGTAAKEIKTYTIEDHLKKSNDKVTELFQKMREQVLLLDPALIEKPVSWYIGYQLKGYVVVSFQIYTDKIIVNLNIKNPLDPEKRLKLAPKSWQTWNKLPAYRFKLTSENDILYIMKIINQSYTYRKNT